MNFKDFNLNAEILESLEAMGYSEPTPVQEQAIPVILEKKDIIACAQTGTGKTAAYLLPTIHNIIGNPTKGINTIIIAPTRELAVQIDQAVEGFTYFTPVTSIAVYGGGSGSDFDRERSALQKGADFVIATPGRLISHLNLGYVKLENLQHLILDEADRMLDMGFNDDILKIVQYLPTNRQNLLFSATMPPKIRSFAKKILKDPEEVSIAIAKPAEGVVQAAFVVHDGQKIPLIKHILSAKKLPSVIVFCSTKSSVKDVYRELKNLKFNCASIHSDLLQNEREEVLRSFKNGDVNIIVATDIISRGIDIESISLVVNFDVPNDAEDYIHRIGRTARAASTGVAFTFINQKDQFKFSKIEELIEKSVPKAKLPQSIGEGPEYNPKANRGLDRRGGGRKFSNKKRSK